jgi:hypothetical protein
MYFKIVWSEEQCGADACAYSSSCGLARQTVIVCFLFFNDVWSLHHTLS